jgi:hypothetical protein
MHPTTLLTFASRQIWPQVLAILNRAPSRLILFHSEEAAESSRPAARLRDFVVATGQLPADGVELVSVPATNLHQIREAISQVAERLELGDLNCEFHLTGGNKLMALAAFDWCRLNGSPCFYIERDRQILQFSPEKGELIQRPPGHLEIDLGQSIDPVHLVRCQLDSAEVVDPGQLVTLSLDGEKMPWQEIGPLLNRESYDFRRLLRIEGPEPEGRAGDQLELATAFAVLKAGVPRVRRGLRTTARARTADGRDEGEQDLIFNWRGRLWVVDCKDRHSPETRIDQLRSELVSTSAISPRVRDLLEKLTGELKDKELMTLKQDLQAVSEAGGLMGRTLVVRREALPAQAADFARSRKMGVVLKDRLYLDLLRQLSG